MPFNSRAYRVLIASPSDVEEEREIAIRVIQEWNDLHSYGRGVVLLPLRWETHSAPEYGTRPQEVINRAIVDHCDLLIGIFWTRIGTPTGVADSGTLEEIDRVAQAGKPIMLYFSKVGMDPDRIDLGQLDRLKTFKAATYPNALTESYKSHVEFRDKFARQLELRVRDLQKADTSTGPPPLALSFASQDLKSLDGSIVNRSVDVIDVIDLEAKIADTDDKIAGRIKDAILASVKRVATVPAVLAISNTGTSGFRNLYVEIDVTTTADLVVSEKAPTGPDLFSSYEILLDHFLAKEYNHEKLLEWKGPDVEWADGPDLREGFKKTDTGWRLSFEWPALQPSRKRWVTPRLFINAQSDGTVRFVARIFADSLPEPATLEAVLNVAVMRRTVHVADLVERVDGEPKKRGRPTP